MARRGMGPLLLAGLAAFGYYKYSKMSEQQKSDLKAKGKRLFDENVPQGVKDLFGKKQTTQGNNSYNHGQM